MADSIVVAVREPPPFVLTATPAKTTVNAGEKLPISVHVDRTDGWAENVQLSGFDLPPGASLGLVTVAKSTGDGKVEVALPANTRPGTYTFTITGAGQVPRDYAREHDAKKRRGPNVRDVYPSNAITVTVGVTSASK
jgi:hypothetical protein